MTYGEPILNPGMLPNISYTFSGSNDSIGTVQVDFYPMNSTEQEADDNFQDLLDFISSWPGFAQAPTGQKTYGMLESVTVTE